ncbi:MAG: hypothetical protein FGM16_02775 [Flavobacterium sp.]|nr:hypothetical protein [Flavobacterium sp.]
MKPIKFLASITLLVLLSLSCSSSDNSTPSCDDLAAATDAAELAYNSSNTTQNCNAYKTALQNEIAACSDPDGSLQAIVASLGDCSVPQNGGVISVRVGSYVKTFETNITITTIGANRKIKAYDDIQSSDFIEFEVQQGTTGANKVLNFNLHLITSDYNPMPVADGGNFTSNITVNSTTAINGTFYGYVTSPTTGADLELTLGQIGVNIN